MHARRPPVAQLLFHLPAREIEPAAVDVRTAAVGAGHPHHDRRAIGSESESRLALPNGVARAAADEGAGEDVAQQSQPRDQRIGPVALGSDGHERDATDDHVPDFQRKAHQRACAEFLKGRAVDRRVVGSGTTPGAAIESPTRTRRRSSVNSNRLARSHWSSSTIRERAVCTAASTSSRGVAANVVEVSATSRSKRRLSARACCVRAWRRRCTNSPAMSSASTPPTASPPTTYHRYSFHTDGFPFTTTLPGGKRVSLISQRFSACASNVVTLRSRSPAPGGPGDSPRSARAARAAACRPCSRKLITRPPTMPWPMNVSLTP